MRLPFVSIFTAGVAIAATAFMLVNNSSAKAADENVKAVFAEEETVDVEEVEEVVAVEETTAAVENVVEEEEAYVMSETLQSFIDINEDVVATIRMENSNIQYPVMMGAEYLHKDINGNKSIDGSIFVESERSVIFGHNMKNGHMFHDVNSMNYDSFWNQDHTVTIETKNSVSQYEPFLVCYGEADTRIRNIDSEAALNDFLEDKEVSQGSIVEDVNYDDFVILVTCNGNGRTYVFCK